MNRRKFLQSAGIALGALALPTVPHASLSAPSQPTKPLWAALEDCYLSGVRAGKTAHTHASMYAWLRDELTPRGDNVGYIEVGPEFIEVRYEDGGIMFIRG